jgi:pimeloyl-ACP methyl ester carboxylesterase
MRVLVYIAAVATSYAAPCTSAASACTEWLTLPGQSARLLVYRTYPLETGKNESVTRALVVIHGGGRDADGTFRTALAAAFLAGALDNTAIISPRFASNTGRQSRDSGECHDALASNEASWICEVEQRESWRYGGFAQGSNQLTSYDFIDEILRKLARKDVFPNLKAIVVAGHAGGGMVTTLYEMANQVHEKLAVPVSYVVSNISGYAFPDGLRPTANAYPVNAGQPGYTVAPPPTLPAFLPFAEARSCPAYNDWPYGLHNLFGYSARLTEDQLRKQLAARPVTYLLGDLDILPIAGWDNSCSAAAQGPTRFARGIAFAKRANEEYGAKHKIIVVRLCGHNERCMFTAEPALPLLFPR